MSFCPHERSKNPSRMWRLFWEIRNKTEKLTPLDVNHIRPVIISQRDHFSRTDRSCFPNYRHHYPIQSQLLIFICSAAVVVGNDIRGGCQSVKNPSAARNSLVNGVMLLLLWWWRWDSHFGWCRCWQFPKRLFVHKTLKVASVKECGKCSPGKRNKVIDKSVMSFPLQASIM